MSRLLTLVFLVVVSFVQPAVEAANEITSVTLDLVPNRVGNVQVELNLGTLLPGEKTKTQVTLRNLTGKDIHFDSLEIGCGCLSVTPTKGQIRRGEHFDLTIEFSGSARPAKIESQQSFVAMSGGRPVFLLRASARFSNFASFVDRHLIVEIPTGSVQYEFQLPILIGDGVRPGDVSILRKVGLKGLNAQVSLEREAIVCSVSKSDFVDKENTGTLELRCRGSALTSDISLSIGEQPAFRLHPRLAHFKRASGDAEQFVAQMAISVAAQSPAKRMDSPMIEFSIDGIPVPVEIIRSRGRMTWITATISADELREIKRGTILSRVRLGELFEESEVPFFVQERL